MRSIACARFPSPSPCSLAHQRSPGGSSGARLSGTPQQVRRCSPALPVLLTHRPVVGFGPYVFAVCDPSYPSPGITTDLLVYSIIIPVMPFQLENLHFSNVSALTGWLLCAYVRPPSLPRTRSHNSPQSLGLVLCTSRILSSPL